MPLFFFLIIDCYFLILATIAQIINPIVELKIPVEIWTKGAKPEIQIHPVTVKIKVRKCSM